MRQNEVNCEGTDPREMGTRLKELIRSLTVSIETMQEELRQGWIDIDELKESLRQKEQQLDRLTEEMRLKDLETASLKQRLEALQNDPWRSRITYENVVELIASNEDTAQRDISRRLFEMLLKRDQVLQLRRDVKRKVKELQESEGSDGRTFNNYGTYNEVQPGGVNFNGD